MPDYDEGYARYVYQKVSLLSREVHRIETDTYGYDYVVIKTIFFTLDKDYNIKSFESAGNNPKKHLYKIITPDKKKEIKKYIRKFNIDLRETNDMIRLFYFYNAI